jgi:hypothetical protein
LAAFDGVKKSNGACAMLNHRRDFHERVSSLPFAA